MVHVNDETVNDEAIIPFGGMGVSGNGSRFGGEANFDKFTEWQWVTVRDEPPIVPVLMASITEVARLAGVSTATASRVVSSSDYPVSAATRARVLEAARTLDYVPERPRPRAAQEPRPGRRRHRPRHHRPVLRRGRPRRRGRRPSAAGYLVITCSSERNAERERSYVRLLRSIRAAAVVFAGSGLDDPALNEEIDRHLAAMRADGAAVVHLSPHALGEPEVSVDNAAGIAGDGRRARRPRPSPDRVPRRADGRCTSRGSGSPATAAGLDERRHRRSTSASSSAPASTARAARSASTRCSPATRRSPRSAAPTTCWRSARCSASPRSGSTSRATCRSPASTTSRPRP